MMNEQDLNGIFVPTITPFLPSDGIDLNSYQSYLGHILKYQIQGLVINGTTGECPTVAWGEVVQLVESTKDFMQKMGKYTPIIIGTGTNDTNSTVRRTELAGQLGADAVLVVTPYYSKPSQEGILEHYRLVSQVGVPIIAYEVPSRTAVRLTVDTARRIMDLQGVIGLKDSSGGIELISELTRLDTKPVLCGDDLYYHAMLGQGAKGGILASANVHTQTFIDVYNLHHRGKTVNAGRSFDALIPLIQLLFQESNPAPLKWILHRQGILASDKLRLPMTSITEQLKVLLIEELQKLGQHLDA